MTSDATDEIMAATYRALCECGYADLTMQRIADESTMSTAAIHYHYETKESLLNAFLQHVSDRFERKLACEADDPRERLSTILDATFGSASDRDDDFPVAVMELKAQAPFQDRFRTRFRELDATIREVVSTAVRDGIDAGHFADADPELVARFVATSISGGHVREVTLGESPAETRRMVEQGLALHLGWRPEVKA